VSAFRGKHPAIPRPGREGNRDHRIVAHRLTSRDVRERDAAADEVCDYLRSYSSEDASLLPHVLVAARMVETDEGCQETQLHALAELDVWHALPDEAPVRLCHLDRSTVTGSQVEYLSDLLPGWSGQQGPN
jgi:hypothetical protein